MMRLPRFRYLAPRTVADAVAMLRDEPGALVLAGGTDLVPNMKRRQQQPPALISLRHLAELRARDAGPAALVLGAGRTLAEVAGDPAVRDGHAALWRAASQVATAQIRNQATLGGNLCVDTRCNYYNQSLEWRKAIDYCMKAPREHDGVYAGPAANGVAQDGETQGSICWVAPGSPRCWAVSSSDSAPAMIALGAELELVSPRGPRRIPAQALYHDDGMACLTKAPDELLVRVSIPNGGWRSTYWKLRRRGSFDFPVLGVAAALRLQGGAVADARVVIGAVASSPILAERVAAHLVGHPLTDDRIEAAAEEASRLVKPMDNTDFALTWRKTVTRSYVRGALSELRGDDPQKLGALARRATQHLPLPVL